MKKKSAKKKLPTKKTPSKPAKTKKKELKKIRQPKKVVLTEPPSKNKMAKTPRPDIKREEIFVNAVKEHMSNRNVAIIKNDNGTLTIVTKRVLGEKDTIASFNPTDIEIIKKWGIKVGVLKLRISVEALSAILIAFTKMLKTGMLAETKK
jgi:hypothetical protein